MSFEVYQDIGLKPGQQLEDHEAEAAERRAEVEQTIQSWQAGGEKLYTLVSLIKQQLDQARLVKNELYVFNLAQEFLGRINTVDLKGDERDRITKLLNDKLDEHRGVRKMAA